MSTPLAKRLPPPGERLSADEVLNRFVSAVEEQGLSLYPAQEEAILALLEGQHVVLATPTGSGKSLVAQALHFQAMCQGETSVYTCPIKALVNEKFFQLCEAFGPENVGMSTGDASINRDAPILCCTAEVLAQAALRGMRRPYGHVVMDEFHFYGDRERGVAWQLPLLAMESTRFLLMSATLGEVGRITEQVEQTTKRKMVEVRSAQRPVPLEFRYVQTPLHETLEELAAKNRAPVYLVNFTQKQAAEHAQALTSAQLCTRDEKERIWKALEGFAFDTPYGPDVQRFLRAGIGLHHAGLLPKYRLLVERLAQQGLLKVVSGTDTLGVGVNIPLRTVLFTQLCKFDGEKTTQLSVRDFLQIAGRAGRKGFDDEGLVVAQAPEHVIENLRQVEKERQGKKVQPKKQPPTKGYVHWDQSSFEKLQSRPPEALESRFRIDHGMLMHALLAEHPGRGGGYGRLVQLIGRSHDNEHLRKRHRRTLKQCFKGLREAGLIQVVTGEQREGRFVETSPELQKEFSLNHSLSLWLLDTLPKLDANLEGHALDVLSLVEAILENPQVVLWKQVDRLKTEKMAELKARGMEFDERIAELEKVEWPKPNREFIYATFNEFAAKHPWLDVEHIRPKSVVREMVEGFTSFHDYVRSYGLQRSEGLLLRYVADVHRTLANNVPESFRTDEVEDVLAMLRTMLREVDSSLLDEWQQLQNPTAVVAQPTEPAARPRIRVAMDGDVRAFSSRVRHTLHRLVASIGRRSWAEAQALLLDPENAWTPVAFEEAMAGYLATYPSLDFGPRSRRPEWTLLKRTSSGTWSAVQRLVDPEGHGDWMLECELVTEGRTADEALPLVLVRIGS